MYKLYELVRFNKLRVCVSSGEPSKEHLRKCLWLYQHIQTYKPHIQKKKEDEKAGLPR